MAFENVLQKVCKVQLNIFLKTDFYISDISFISICGYT